MAKKVTKKVTKKRVKKNVERGQAHIPVSYTHLTEHPCETQLSKLKQNNRRKHNHDNE